MMANYYPAHVDGNTLVILRPVRRTFTLHFEVVGKGRLSFDGSDLVLVDRDDQSERPVASDELEHLKPVSEENRIAKCAGYDFFLIASDTD